MYREYKQLNLADIDKEILAFWEANDIFKKSVEQRDPANSFVFYEGPPSANGKPGIHHVMARAIKDIFCRYQTLKGKRVERKGGWDTHGLPIELSVEKELGITKEDIGKSISVEEYNQKCRETVMRYKDMWDDITRKIGYWVDLDNPYITYENDYIESVWWLLKQIYDKDLLYKGYTIQPYSPAAGTGLSSHELNMPGAYREVSDTTVVAMFEVTRNEQSEFLYQLEMISTEESPPFPPFGGTEGGPTVSPPREEGREVYILAWTTTPWTLPSNTALTVGPRIFYVKIDTVNPYTDEPVSVVLAADLVDRWLGGKNQPPILARSEPFPGDRLAGIRYEQLQPGPTPEDGDAFRVLVGDFVTTEDGTGVVHTAPSFGADDMRVARANGIGSLTLVDKTGKFTADAGEFAGRYVKDYTDDPNYSDVNVDIAVRLKKEGRALNVAKYVHNYPHCWRTDKPVLYYPLDSWFIRAGALRERMYELNQSINWKPAATGEGRFGKWLENLQDWNLSRSRYWGIPLPIWRTEDGEHEQCIGSVAELGEAIELANEKLGLQQQVPADLHRPYIDDIVLVSPDGQVMRRELDLIDVWFDSGAMPYAQWHYPQAPLPSPRRGETEVPVNGEVFAQEKMITQRVRELYETATPTTYKYLKDHIKVNRKQATEAEAKLWEALRGKQLEGFKFRRQHPIDEFIVDFVCLRKRLIVEVDGDYHLELDAKEADVLRTKILEAHGYNVVRFTNEQVLTGLDAVVSAIKRELAFRPSFSKELLQRGYHLVPPFGGVRGGQFPADFIAEGVDQTRGWFYTLHAIATMVFDSVAFKNVVSNGLVLAKDGMKMSKRLGNTVDPFETVATYGADATRWYLISNSDPWDNLKFDIAGIEEVRRRFFGTLYNTYSFFALYANVDEFVIDERNVIPVAERPEIDRWIISKLHSLIKTVDADFANYEPTPAARRIANFVDEHLSNWYVRLSRRRFWKGTMNDDKRAAYETLYECLMVTAQLMAPIAPFFAEWLYKNLSDGVREKALADQTPLRHESVHLSYLTQAEEDVIDLALEQRMDYAQRISSLVLSLRKKEKIRVRQPLQKILLPVLNADFQAQVEGVKDLILSEVNVKEIEYLTETEGFLQKRIKPNFKTLGRRLGKHMKAAADIIGNLSQADIAEIERTQTFTLGVNGDTYELTLEDFDISAEDIPGWTVATDGELTVALDITLTDELLAEGMARELVNRIQNIRKQLDYNVTDRITVVLEDHPAIRPAIDQFGDYIRNEVLADVLEITAAPGGEVLDLPDGTQVRVEVDRV